MATVDEFVSTYSQALSDRNAAVLAGAGMSIPAGLVNWKGLLRSVAKDIGLDVEREADLVAVAQYHLNERGGRQRLNQTLVTEFAERAKTTENHRILARLPIDVFWTTNYDKLIETALNSAGKKVDLKVTPEDLAHTVHRRDAIVYKMHGDISDPANAVLSKDDYESYGTSRRGQLFATALRGDLVSKTFLFLGFSFSDPNVDYILGRVRVLLEGNRREHYCLMRSVLRHDFQSNREYQYARTKQELQVRDLRRYGVMPVLLDDFSEYTRALRKLERRYKSREIFIAGSAQEYGDWSPEVGEQFLTKLGSTLAARGLNVVTGFGLGVGSFVINGVLDQLESEGTRTVSDRLTLRPFPHSIADPERQRARWKTYRKDMVSRAGVALFVFGNKVDKSGNLIDADGMMEEFKVAHQAGLLIVPVGATGYTAQKIHGIVSESFDEYFPAQRGLKTALSALAKSGSPSEVITRIIRFIDLSSLGRINQQ